MFCKNCGSRVSQGDVFCQNCGIKIEWENGVPKSRSPGQKRNKTQKASSVILKIMGVVIVVLIGVIGWGSYTIYKLNRDADVAVVSDTNPDIIVSEKTDFEYFVKISNDTLSGVHIGYNSNSILDSLTLVYEDNDSTLQRSREGSDFTAVKASSTLDPTSHSTYYPENILDGGKNTSWIEGAEGFGEGEWIELSAMSAHKVYGLCVRNGCTKEEKRLIKNAQAKKIQVKFSDGSSNEYELEKTQDTNQECSNVILFTSGPVETEKIRIKILSVYESQDYVDPVTREFFARDLDTAISDIYVLQWDGEKDMKK